MITKEKMLPMLVESCPSFADKWQEHKELYQYEEDFLPYVALGDFGRHLSELEKQKKTDEFEKVFDLFEKFHLEGDNFVREAATAGCLESLMNHKNTEKLVEHLRPESLKWWNEVIKFWKSEIQYIGQTYESEK